MVPQDYQNFVAAFVGSVIGASKETHKNHLSYALSVLTGTASSVYLTPIIASAINMTDPKHQLGLSFLVGTLGLKTIEYFSKKIISQLEKKNIDN